MYTHSNKMNKKVKTIKLERPEYKDDSRRIKDILSLNGYNVTIIEAEQLWLTYSESMAASWMMLPEKDEEVLECVNLYQEMTNKNQQTVEKIPEELQSLDGMAEWFARHFMPTVDLDVDPPVIYQINYEDAKKRLVKYVLPRIKLQLQKETLSSIEKEAVEYKAPKGVTVPTICIPKTIWEKYKNE